MQQNDLYWKIECSLEKVFTTFTALRSSLPVGRAPQVETVLDGKSSGRESSVADRCIARGASRIIPVLSSNTIHGWQAGTSVKALEAGTARTSCTSSNEHDDTAKSESEDNGRVYNLIIRAVQIFSQIPYVYEYCTSQSQLPFRVVQENVTINEATLLDNNSSRSPTCSNWWTKRYKLNKSTHRHWPDLKGIRTGPRFWAMHTGPEKRIRVAGPTKREEHTNLSSHYTRGRTICC